MRLLTLFILPAFSSVYGEVSIPESVSDSLYAIIVNNGPDA